MFSLKRNTKFTVNFDKKEHNKIIIIHKEGYVLTLSNSLKDR